MKINNKPTNKQSSILLVFCLVLFITSSGVQACEDQLQTTTMNFIDSQNNTHQEIISFKPLWVCENQEVNNDQDNSLFLIKRENYSLFGGEEELNYAIFFIAENENINLQNISKLIRSYSATNTGENPNNFSNIKELRIQTPTNNLSWFFLSDTPLNTTNNINITNSSNITNNIITNSSNETNPDTINANNNATTTTNITTTTNTTTNNSVLNQTDLTNQSNQTTNTTTNTTTITTNNTPSCVVKTNKVLFEDEQQVAFWFESEYAKISSVTYWIEDIQGNILKNKYTSTNTNEKHFTWNLNTNQQISYVYAQCCFNENKCIINKSLILGYKQKQEETQETTTNENTTTEELFATEKENSISFSKTKILNSEDMLLLEINIHIKKYQGRSQLVTCSVQTKTNEPASFDTTLVAKTTGEFETRIRLPLFIEDEEYTIKCEGLQTNNLTIIKNTLFKENDEEKITTITSDTIKLEENSKNNVIEKEYSQTSFTQPQEEELLQKITGLSYANPQVEKEEKLFIYSGLGAILMILFWFLFKYDLKRNNSFIKQVLLKMKYILKNR